MKKAFVIIIVNTLFPCFTRAYNAPLDTIKQSMVDFLIKTENITKDYSIDDFCNCLILEIKSKKQIDENSKGIFLFSTLSSFEYTHLIFIDEDSFYIINMRDLFDKALQQLLLFFKKNAEYTRSDIIYYLQEMIKIYNKNLVKGLNHIIVPSS